MARRKKQNAEESIAGAPKWMVTFSDCMTLLLTFFVLLLSFSSFDVRIYDKMRTTMLKDLDQVFRIKESLNSVSPPQKIVETDNPDRGSEKPTIDKEQSAVPEQTPDDNFRERKVFITPSARIFWGQGTTISSDGTELLDVMAEFLTKMQGKIVLSEVSNTSDSNPGIERALTVLNYIADRGVEKARLSISFNSVLSEGVIEDYIKGRAAHEDSRRVEIVILERSVFN